MIRCVPLQKNIGRDGEEYAIMSLAELRNYSADMFTTVFIGNSMTKKYRRKKWLHREGIKMYDVVLFGGTDEGHKIADFLSEQKVSYIVCVATEYGAELLDMKKSCASEE